MPRLCGSWVSTAVCCFMGFLLPVERASLLGNPYKQENILAAEVVTDPESCPSRKPGAHKGARIGLPIVEAYVGERHAHGTST
ncbi:unnamed protein product [Echinostoma caproni]|uniref:Secreted protein n=1 Tax=Echinostoma caproni TaxID=27848 RepID=A0A183AG61_9TREM|nr:unnamed protein product [Echinostoma caproni]